MGGRLTTVTRGMFIVKTDEAFEKPTVEQLTELEAQSADGFTEWGRTKNKLPKRGTDKTHVEDEFLADAGYFPPDQTIPDTTGKRAILLSGCIQALRVALFVNPDEPAERRRPRPHGLPVVSYWIAGGPRFEVYVALSNTGQEVHMMIMTPDPRKPAKIPGTPRSENIWAIGTDALINQLHTRLKEAWPQITKETFKIKGASGHQTYSY